MSALFIEGNSIPLLQKLLIDQLVRHQIVLIFLFRFVIKIKLTDGREVVSITHRSRSIPQKHFCFCFLYSFLLEAG
jgi:hypothetical protein